MKIQILIHLIVFFILQKPLQAQTTIGTIKGKVVDDEGLHLPGVYVALKYSNYKQTTDPTGAFSIDAPEGTYTLLTQRLGKQLAEQKIEIKSSEIIHVQTIVLKDSITLLKDAVVTGQFEAQSLKNSVYQVRTIDSERIRLRGATNLQAILSTELGMRFSNDLTLGTTDVQLMGMSGQNVKILLDGIPMVDRGSTRESIGQIDINTIERIEIVEGPMSVIYGTDALAGVINIITKKGTDFNNLTLTARVQEETAGNEYKAFSGKGTHNQNIGITWQHHGFQVAGSVSRNNFGGWQGKATGRATEWLPKDQMLYTASLKYRKERWNAWYRFNGTDEEITSLGNLNNEMVASDKSYTTFRWFHQLQGEFRQNDKLSYTGAFSYTDYTRKTLTTNLDIISGKRTLSLDSSAQDKSLFNTAFFRGTTQYKLTPKFFLLAGIDISNNSSSGARILGAPTINEYALFLSPEWKITPSFKLSPGLRFIKNSIYDAPPVVPSLNGKISINKRLDLRFGYARGFRSPALRELYFNFHDASHSINGNQNLKAEYSNSFNVFAVYQLVERTDFRANTTIGSFYNIFHDLIDTGVNPQNQSQTTYLNVNLFKTQGLTLENKIFYRNLQATLGASYIGRYNKFSVEETTNLPSFTWSSEINTNVLYTLPKMGASVNLFYKYTGKKPIYELTSGTSIPTLAETSGFHLLDFTFSKNLCRYINLIGGTKNIFNVTSLNNTSSDVGGGHSTGGAVPMSYGRSYFLGINVQWSKN
jgi:outer membrane receptor for ferrienterochelin and colicins